MVVVDGRDRDPGERDERHDDDARLVLVWRESVTKPPPGSAETAEIVNVAPSRNSASTVEAPCSWQKRVI